MQCEFYALYRLVSLECQGQFAAGGEGEGEGVLGVLLGEDDASLGNAWWGLAEEFDPGCSRGQARDTPIGVNLDLSRVLGANPEGNAFTIGDVNGWLGLRL